MDFKINLRERPGSAAMMAVGLAALVAGARSASATYPPEATLPGTAPVPRAATVDATPAPVLSPVAPASSGQLPGAGSAVPAPAATPAAPAEGPKMDLPKMDLPPERDMPAVTLPRESAIENPLGRAPAFSGTAIGGYGELTLNAPGAGTATVDMRRLVLYVGHSFSERIRFYSELELEHAIASSADQGEFEVEQAYLDGLFGRRLNLRGGLIIMPVGIINVYHEPPTFNGVDRPDVDVLIIPSTWREPGFGIFGELATGLSYQLYVVNGFNANGFRADTGIGDGHQEAQFAAARDFGGVLRLALEPRLATVFGISAYAATSGNSLRSSVGEVPVALFEADARTRVRGFTGRAELAVAFVGDAGALNQALLAGSPEQMAAVPVASRMTGGYVEAGYDLLRWFAPASDQDVTVFGRFDYANTQSSVPTGFVANPLFKRFTYTAGVVYRPLPQIGLKGDYRRHEFGAGRGFNELAGAITWMF